MRGRKGGREGGREGGKEDVNGEGERREGRGVLQYNIIHRQTCSLHLQFSSHFLG